MAQPSQSRSPNPKTARKRNEEIMEPVAPIFRVAKMTGGGDPLNPDDGPGGVGGNGPTKPPPPPPPPGG